MRPPPDPITSISSLLTFEQSLCQLQSRAEGSFPPVEWKNFPTQQRCLGKPTIESDTTPHSTATSIFFFRFSTLCIFLSYIFFTFYEGEWKISRLTGQRHTRENTTRIRPNSRTIPCKLMSSEFSTRVNCFLCVHSLKNSRSFPLFLVAFPREPTLVPACLNFNPNSIHWTGCAAGEDEGWGLFCVPSWYILSVRYILQSPPTQAQQLKICYVIYKADMYPTLKNKQGMKL